jgi:hypothetical protein
MRRTLRHPAALSQSVWLAGAGRVMLAVLFGLGILVPSFGRVAPVAAQASTVSFSTAEVAPADSLAYLVMTLDDESEQWRLADELLDRAGIGQALEEELGEEFRNETGEDLPLDAFLGGEVGVVVSPTVLAMLAEESMGASLDEMMGDAAMESPEAESTEPEPQGVAIALDARAPDTAWAGIRESILEEEQNEEFTYEGTTILYAPPASDEDEGMAAAQVGELILIATAPEDLHPLIDTADGRTPSITTVPEFTSARDALTGEFLIFAFGNSFDATAADLGMFAMAASQLGTESFSGMTIAADEPGFRMESVTLPAEGERLPPIGPNFESELLTRAPDDAILFTSAADLGSTGVLDIIGVTLLGLAMGTGSGEAAATPEPGASVDDYIAEQYEAAESLIGINLQTDLFQQLAREYGAWFSANLESDAMSGLFVSGVSDPETVSNTLMQLSFLIQGASGAESPLTTREVGGGQVYVIELGDEAGSTIEFGVVDENLVIGTGDAVDRFAEPTADSLAENSQFQAVMDTLPAEYNGLTYIDLSQALPLLETVAEESDELGLSGMDEIPDASESCANYGSQEEAQAAYDAAEADTFDLDQDFDGQVCEDFFAAAAPEASGDDGNATETADALADVDYSALKAFAVTSYEEDGLGRSSAILYISE